MLYSQPGIFNVLDYGMVPNDISAAEANALALQNAIDAAQANCASPSAQAYGGIILLPSNDTIPIADSPPNDGDGGTYYIAMPSSPPGKSAVVVDCFYPLLFLGTGSGTTLEMVGSSSGDFGNLFQLETGGGSTNANIGGIAFQDFQIRYGEGATDGVGIVIDHNSLNVRLLRMNFIDCPVAVSIPYALQASLIDCRTLNDLNAGTPLQLGGGGGSGHPKEVYVAGCIFEAIGSAAGAPGTAGISLMQAEELRVVNTRIDSFEQGISTLASSSFSTRLYFEDVSVFAMSFDPTVGAALYLGADGGSVAIAEFVTCDFQPAEGGTAYTGSGIMLAGSPVAVLDQVRLTSCSSCGWTGAGLEMTGGTNIEVLGGAYCCNGAPFSPPNDLSAGIALTGAVDGVRIVGASCTNSVYDPDASPPGFEEATQEYGITIPNGAARNVIVDACDLSGNLSNGLSVVSSIADPVVDVLVRACNMKDNGLGAVAVDGNPGMQVTGCAGYNDQAKVLTQTLTASPVTITNTGHGYYGPIAFYISESSGITIDGVLTGLLSGGFTLGPNETATVTYGGSPTFLVVGK